MDTIKLHKYAEVIVKKALQIKKGQYLYVDALLEAKDFVIALAEEAFNAGAADINVHWQCNELDRIKLMIPDNNELAKLTPADYATVDFYAEKNAAYIRIDSPDLEIFKNVSIENIQQKAISDRTIRERFRKNSFGSSTIVCVPSTHWAKAVYPDLTPEEGVEKLWDAVFECVRCNEADPLAAWDTFIANTRKRRTLLTEKHYKTFHYKSAVTDLYISPIDDQKWNGGCVDSDNPDIYFIPNIPTEEVFTCPNKYKVNGYVTSTRPLNFKGRIINNFKLTLKDGKVIDYYAKEGQDVLKSILETDAGSCYFGEMALIDKNSPISRLNTVFYTTLYDENASCHIALGLAGAPKMDSEEREKLGINFSSLHVDFMVGSDDLNIKGELADGTWEDVFIDGCWAPEFTI